MAYHYAISALRTSEATAPDKIMLYRFKSKQTRSKWCSLSDYRLAVTRDIARLLFPKLRGCCNHAIYWAPLVLSTIDHEADPTQPQTPAASCEYMLDPVNGGVAMASWEMIPDAVPDSETVKNKFRRELERARWKAQFVK